MAGSQRKTKKPPLGPKEKVLFYAGILGAVLAVLAALPPMPWRYARADPNIGMRFPSDRRYTLFSATNQYSQAVSYMRYRTKMCGKVREFAAASPMAAIAGIVSSQLKTGGAIAGCSAWKACTTHTSARCTGYGTLAAAGIFAFCSILVGALCGLASAVLLSQEPPPGNNSKKKIAYDEARQKTMMASCASFGFVSLGTVTFNFTFASAINTFRATGYWPWPDASFGTYIALIACLILAAQAFCGVTRIYPLSGNKEEDEDEDQQQQQQDFYMAQQAALGPGFAAGNTGAPPWNGAY